MIGNEVVVEKINHEDPAVARRLVEMLRPRETHALFLLGNLKNNYPESHLYVARRGDDGSGGGVGGAGAEGTAGERCYDCKPDQPLESISHGFDSA